MNRVLIASFIFLSACNSVARAANVALLSDGASINYTSSALSNLNESAAEEDLLSSLNLPSIVGQTQGDARYIFGPDDSNQTVIVDLGQNYDISSAAVTFETYDRWLVGPVTVETSTDGTDYTVFGSSTTYSTDINDNGKFTITGSNPVMAEYVEFKLGPSVEYDSGGSGIERLYVNSVPEPFSWSLMVIGFGFVGALFRSRVAKKFAA